MRRIQLNARGGGACETEAWLVKLTLRAGGASSLEIATGKEMEAAIDWSATALFATADKRSALV